MPIGTTELIIILVIVLVLFGASRVPELGKSLGAGMRNFKDAVTGRGGDDHDAEASQPAQLGPATTPSQAGERAGAEDPAGEPASGVPVEPEHTAAARPGDASR
jgi:sec-independent protein translocase protein TatA